MNYMQPFFVNMDDEMLHEMKIKEQDQQGVKIGEKNQEKYDGYSW